MASYDCDSAQVKILFQSLTQGILEAGGIVHESVIIKERGGNLSVKSTLDPYCLDVLLAVPWEALVPVENLKFSLQDDQIVVEDGWDTLLPTQAQQCRDMLALYNATGKIASHLATHPAYVLSEKHPVWQHIQAARHASCFGLLPQSDTVRSFINTRTFSLADSTDKPTSTGKTTSVLMPLIDCLNHHPRAEPFDLEQGLQPGQRGISVTNSQPVADSHEAYVVYGRYDALDLFTMYGFVEERAHFVAATPLTIRLSNGYEILVLSMKGRGVRGKMLPAMQHLRPVMPSIVRKENDQLGISHLLIPTESKSTSLRRIVGRLIELFQPQLTSQLTAEIVSAEQQVLQATTAYYEQLANLAAEHMPDAAEAHRLARIQLKKIRAYQPVT